MSSDGSLIVKVSPDAAADDPGLLRAAHILRGQGLVAFPTETVYGLGALALSTRAVKKIFAAKARPATNPLIVHVASVAQAKELVRHWPTQAQKLADAFWPGPLTMVLPRRHEVVPDAVCAGLDTVAIRLPGHPVARRLIEAVGQPLAAPSANRYTEVSPTRAEHVRQGLGDRVDLIVDGGDCQVGLESTLVALGDSGIEILRPGMIDTRQLAAVVAVLPFFRQAVDDDEQRPSPGLSKRHYSPAASVQIVSADAFAECLEQAVAGRRLLGLAGPQRSPRPDCQWLPDDPDGYARRLYGALRALDGNDVERIIIEAPPQQARWLAIHDRLSRMGAA